MGIPLELTDEPRIVYEDDSLLAVHKPVRMHSAPGQGGGGLCAWVFERYPEARDVGGRPGAKGPEARSSEGAPPEGGLLHRLDYETSGLVLFARGQEAFAALLEQQAKGSFKKEYIALSSASSEARPQGSKPERGLPLGVEGEAWAEAREAQDAQAIAELLAEASRAQRGPAVLCAFRPFGPKGAKVACLDPELGAAGATYRSELLGARPSPRPLGALVLRVALTRGFRHQIRAGLAWIGLPILGDPLYGGAEDARLRLYAAALSFVHPATGRPLCLRDEADFTRWANEA